MLPVHIDFSIALRTCNAHFSRIQIHACSLPLQILSPYSASNTSCTYEACQSSYSYWQPEAMSSYITRKLFRTFWKFRFTVHSTNSLSLLNIKRQIQFVIFLHLTFNVLCRKHCTNKNGSMSHLHVIIIFQVNKQSGNLLQQIHYFHSFHLILLHVTSPTRTSILSTTFILKKTKTTVWTCKSNLTYMQKQHLLKAWTLSSETELINCT